MNDVLRFIEALKQGDVEFCTRHQEAEWGCRYLGRGRFEHWHRNYQMTDTAGREELDEAGVVTLFARYPVELLQKGLVAKRQNICG